MFTGIVEDVGQIARVEPLPSERARRLTVRAPLLAEEQALGASLAVDGCCLTVVVWRPGEVELVAGPETLERTTLGLLADGARVNLERPLRWAIGWAATWSPATSTASARIASVTPRAEAVDVAWNCEPQPASLCDREGLDRHRRHQPDGQPRRRARLRGVAHPAHADRDDAGATKARAPR